MPGFGEVRFLDGEEDCDAEFQTRGSGPQAASKNVKLNAGNSIPRAFPFRAQDANMSWGLLMGQPAGFGDMIVFKVQKHVGGKPDGQPVGYVIPRDGHTGDCAMASLAILSSGDAVAYLNLNGQLVQVSVQGPGAWGAEPYQFV